MPRLCGHVLLAVLPTGWPPPARAEQAQSAKPAYTLPITPGPGITWAGHLDTEWLANLGGGRASGTAADTVGHVGFSVGSSYLHLPAGGRLTVGLLGVAARGSQDGMFGATQTLSNDWAPSLVRLYDFKWRQDFGADKTLRLGMMNVSDYFGAVRAGDQLLNASFGLAPTISANVPLAATYPYTGTGVVYRQVAGGWTGIGGVFQGNPTKPGRPFRGGYMALAELDRPWSGGTARTLAGLGLWRYRPAPGEQEAWGWYGLADGQGRWAGRPLGWFAQWGAGSGGQGSVPYYLGLGLRLEAPWASRGRDALSLGVARAWLNDTSHTAETVLEATYVWRFDKSLYLQPDLQWVLHPGGTYPDVLAGILRLHLEFF